MLAKLKITNEDQFNEVYFRSIANEIFIEAYELLIKDLKKGTIKFNIVTEDCFFVFDGYHAKTNTFFYKMDKHSLSEI